MGGNIFADKTAPILRENIPPTLKAYFAELEQLFPHQVIFNMYYFESLGSVGKKPVSGDIDLGINNHYIFDIHTDNLANELKSWNLTVPEFEETFNLLKSRAKTASDDQLRMKAFLLNLVRYINLHAPTIHCDEKKVTDSSIFGYYPQKDLNGNDTGECVQIDWMIGDLDWLRFSYYSAAYPDDSNVKGLHRTQMVLSAFQVADLSFSHGIGVRDKTTKEWLARNPVQALSILNERLGTKLTTDTVADYYVLSETLSNQLDSEKYSKMLDTYFKILDSTRADIPDNLQEEWIGRKDRLVLTGKFLPENSKLKVMV